MKTLNKSFNDCWNYLSTLHEVIIRFDKIQIILDNKPKINKKDWTYYISSLINLTIIGQRNKWLTIMPNRKGRLTYYMIDLKIANLPQEEIELLISIELEKRKKKK